MREVEPVGLPADQVPTHTHVLFVLFFWLLLNSFHLLSFFQTWQFEGEELALDDPNIVDALTTSEDFLMEGTLDRKQHTQRWGQHGLLRWKYSAKVACLIPMFVCVVL